MYLDSVKTALWCRPDKLKDSSDIGCQRSSPCLCWVRIIRAFKKHTVFICETASLQYPRKLPISYWCIQLLPGRAYPVCSLTGFNHSVGPFPRFFFQDAFSISCKINVLQTAMLCASPHLKENSCLCLKLSVGVRSTLLLDAEHLWAMF